MASASNIHGITDFLSKLTTKSTTLFAWFSASIGSVTTFSEYPIDILDWNPDDVLDRLTDDLLCLTCVSVESLLSILTWSADSLFSLLFLSALMTPANINSLNRGTSAFLN